MNNTSSVQLRFACSTSAAWRRGASALLLAAALLAALGDSAWAQHAALADSAPAEAASSAPSAGGSLLRVIYDGGPLMWPITGGSIVLLVFVMERLVMLRRARVVPKPFVQKFLEQLRGGQLGRESALELCETSGSPVARVFAAAVKKWGRPAVEVEQAVIDAGERVTHELRRYLRLFNGISSLSPLMGLLGTVLGMITAFNAIVTDQAMGKAELLAGGIGQALLTTAGGLVVAIPALMAYMYFQSRVETLVMDIDAAAQQVVDIVSAEGMERDGVGRSKKKAA
jgi:biopolymer transport protein ExbB